MSSLPRRGFFLMLGAAGASTPVLLFPSVLAATLQEDADVTPDAGDSLDSVRNYLNRFSNSGDARYLRYAVASLNSISRNNSNSTDIHLLQARILQSQHRFAAAANTLRLRASSRRVLLKRST